MKYKACIFDFDLTLADSSPGILICFKHTLEKFGCPIPDDLTIYKTIGLTLVDGFDVLTGIKNNPLREQMREEYTRKADEVMSAQTYFYDDTLRILEGLRGAGVKVGILSTKLRYRIVESFEMKIGSLPVDEIIGAEDVGAAKPDPSGLLMMIRRLGVSKEQALYVGDSYIDAQTAMAAGVDFAATATGSTSAEELMKYPNVWVGKSLTEIFSAINNNA